MVTITLAGLERAITAERIRSYLAGGRRLAELTEAEIRTRWHAARAAWEAAPPADKAAAWLPAADAEGELLLRGLPLPVPLVTGAEGREGDVVDVDTADLPAHLQVLLADAVAAGRRQ